MSASADDSGRRRAGAPAAGARPAAGERWRLLLYGGTPREVLARIVDGDPLGVRPLVGARLRSRHLLMDADRLHLRALALCARHARSYRGRPPFEAWLAGLVDRAIAERLEEEARREPGGAEGAGPWHELARPLGLDAEHMRAASARFNLLADREREALYHLLLERRGAEAEARRTGESLTRVARRARRALCVFLRPETKSAEQEATE